MKKTKMLMLVVLLVVFSISLTGCGNKQTVRLDDNSTVTFEGDEASGQITSEDGSVNYGTNLSWPSDAMGNLPKIGGTITAVFRNDSENSCTVSVANLSNTDAQAYAGKISGLGYTQDSLNFNDGGTLMASGKAENGDYVSFMYTVEDQTGVLSFTKGE